MEDQKGTNMSEFDVRQRTVFVVDGNTLHDVQYGILSIYYLAKDGVFGIKVCLFSIRDKELGLVGVRSRICHCDDATGVELWVGKNDEHGRQRCQKFGLRRRSGESGEWTQGDTFNVERISSAKGLPQIDWPPLPVPVGSPV